MHLATIIALDGTRVARAIGGTSAGIVDASKDIRATVVVATRTAVMATPAKVEAAKEICVPFKRKWFSLG